MRGPIAAAILAPVAAEPVKKTPSSRCSSSAAPDVAGADQGREHGFGDARTVQQASDVQPR
jgi:hypothetical protein